MPRGVFVFYSVYLYGKTIKFSLPASRLAFEPNLTFIRVNILSTSTVVGFFFIHSYNACLKSKILPRYAQKKQKKFLRRYIE